MVFRHVNLRVYQSAKQLHKKVVFSTQAYTYEFYYIKNQARRASLSIALQIAEGSAYGSDKNFNRYIGIALGSANELAACIDISYELELITEETRDELISMCAMLTNQLGSFSKKLKGSITKQEARS